MTAPFFDTNIVIDWMFDRGAAKAELALYSQHRVSRIVWTEVLAGEPAETRRTVQTLLGRFEIVEVDQRVAIAAAEIRCRTRMKLLDALILATAQTIGTVLITRNTKDFPAGMPGIRVPYTL